jgi:hypothetical protein
MKYAVGTGTGDMMNILSFTKLGSFNQEADKVGCKQTRRGYADVISLFTFF